jgi:hypothetical protein
MLWLERRVVGALAGPDDAGHDGAISAFVDSSLRAMPAHLRVGVAAESLLLGAWVRVREGSHPAAEAVREHLAAWERFPIGVIRQYPQLLGSLVLFARHELAAP